MVIVKSKGQQARDHCLGYYTLPYIVNFLVIVKSKGQQARDHCLECYTLPYIVNFMVIVSPKDNKLEIAVFSVTPFFT